MSNHWPLCEVYAYKNKPLGLINLDLFSSQIDFEI